MTTAKNTYGQELSELKNDLIRFNKKKQLFGWLRLFTMILALILIGYVWKNDLPVLLILPFILIGLFIFILAKDINNTAAIENTLRLQQINKTEIDVLNHQFTHLPDGIMYKPGAHEYASDLDIFGRASIFQYINRTTSEQGSKLFANWLLQPTDKETILLRQQAIKELSAEIKWRQQLQSHGLTNPATVDIQQKIESWIQEPDQFLHRISWLVFKYLLPVISFTWLVLHLAGVISATFFYPLIFIMLIISFAVSKIVMPVYLQLNKIASRLASLSDSISWIEEKDFHTPLLQQIKNKYKTGHSVTSASINKLKKILDMLDIRLNPLIFIPLNTFLFWDLQQVFALEKWKDANKENISDWFNALAELECLSSLANLHFNHPSNSFPELSNKEGIFIAEEMGHPLIPKEKLVCNSFSTEGLNQMNLVTGSNMAGKSTFLRSVGVNIVLAMMGSSVFARSFILSPVKVLSSMRVNDNLEESTSTFYAELKKLKEVIDAVYKNEKVFLLLDEILRGTNSADRHTGSTSLIKQLIQHNATGLIATHDLELAKLADEFPANIHNYHFDVQVANDELYFDYKLKRGICRSMNASLLMKKIGIEI